MRGQRPVPRLFGVAWAPLARSHAPVAEPAVDAATAGDEAVVWPALESLYLKLTERPGLRAADFEAPQKPDSLPWMAVALADPLNVPHWAGDFERCLAHAFLS